MEKKVALIMLGVLLFGTSALYAGEPAKKENAFKQIAAIERRGVVNFLTTPGEFVYTLKTERQDHPKAWPLTYIPRAFTNMATRVGSSAADVLVLPWYTTRAGDASPLTRRFDMPDYVWEKN